jgi:hypothetical protein
MGSPETQNGSNNFAVVPRDERGRILPGTQFGPGYTKTDIVELRAKYRHKLPKLLENLFVLAEPDKPYMVQIAATKEILDRLIGKPQVTIDAVTTKVDVAQLYLQAMRRANAEIVPSNSHVVPSGPAEAIEVEGKHCDTGTS